MRHAAANAALHMTFRRYSQHMAGDEPGSSSLGQEADGRAHLPAYPSAVRDGFQTLA